MTTGKLFAEGFPFKFPGGEVQVKVNSGQMSKSTEAIITFPKKVRNSDDIMEILMTVDALRRSGHKRLRLQLPYVPYGRQDRVMVEGEALGVKVFADLINSCNFEEVEIWDPHSDVTTALINNVRVVGQEELLFKLATEFGSSSIIRESVLVCPDAGARKKILKVAAALNKTEIVFADKIRDVKTGQITGTTVDFSSTTVHYGRKGVKESFLVVDDICDGGRTFVELAKVMQAQFQEEYIPSLYLYITHGFFSKGLDELAQYFRGVYVANLMSQDPKVLEHPVLRVAK